MAPRLAQVATADVTVRYLLAEQIRFLRDVGYEVTAICSPGPYIRDLVAEGIDVHPIPMARELSPLADARSLRALVRHFTEANYAGVITHTPKAGILGPLAARLARVPVVIHTVHGLLVHDRMPLLRRVVGLAIERFTAAFSDYLFFQSRDDIAFARRSRLKPISRLLYLGNGIDPQRFSRKKDPGLRASIRRRVGVPETAFVVGTVGRLVWEKGYAELFRAAAILAEKYREMCVVVIGSVEPDQRDGLTPQDLDRLRGRSNLRFLGHRHDLPELYAMMDLFILPSHREGIPRSLMEASAMELPVIASDIRGCREVVVDGVTGLLVPVRDAAALAAAIARLYRQPEVAHAMGQAGRAHIVVNFDERAVLDRLRDHLEDLIPAHGRRRRGSPAACGLEPW
jgi:glycosyltransferase involved in cell wall biosynthesis